MTDKEFDFDDESSDDMADFDRIVEEVDAEDAIDHFVEPEKKPRRTSKKADQSARASKEPVVEKAVASKVPQTSKMMMAVCIGVFVIGIGSLAWTLFRDQLPKQQIPGAAGFAALMPKGQVWEPQNQRQGGIDDGMQKAQQLSTEHDSDREVEQKARATIGQLGRPEALLVEAGLDEGPARALSIDEGSWESQNQIRLDVGGEDDLRALLSKEWMVNANQQKQILQLEAQQAMLNLELIEQRRNTAASMRASAEASKVVLTLRDILKGLQADVESVRGAVQKGNKQIEELDRRLVQLRQLQQQIKESESHRQTNESVTAVQTVARQDKPKTVANPKPKAQPREQSNEPVAQTGGAKRLYAFEPVMVTERGAYVHNVMSDERYVLSVGDRYPEFGRVVKVDVDNASIWGVDDKGNEWIIQKRSGIIGQ